MYRININLSELELKRKTLIRDFQNSKSWKCNPNIKFGDLVPVAYSDQNSNKKVLLCMKWGIDKFNNQKLNGFAKIESIHQKWSQGQPCVIPAKGFYLNYQNENKTKSSDFYYFKENEDNMLYFAAIFLSIKTYNTTKYCALVLTKSTDDDENLFAYQNRMPVMIQKQSVPVWLNWNANHDEFLTFVKKQTVTLSDGTLIGNALQNHDIKDEKIIMQSKQEWESENKWASEASNIDWDQINY